MYFALRVTSAARMTSTAGFYGLVTEDSSSDMFTGTRSVTTAELPHPTTDSNVTGENTQHSVSVIQTTIYAVIGVVCPFSSFVPLQIGRLQIKQETHC